MTTSLLKLSRVILFLVIPAYLLSCSTQKRVPYYLETMDSLPESEVKFNELKIQKNDRLSIQVYSASTIPEVDALYNLPVVGEGNTGGFLVDANGNIEYPRLGTIHAEGLTKGQLADAIKERLTKPVPLLTNPTVIIRFLDYKITILGEVGQQGVITVPGEKITILEAIGLAGGITDYGKKEQVKVIRETDGKRQTGFVDLSTDKVFDSPFYHLIQNDVIIVYQTKQKAKLDQQNVVAQRVSFALSVITAAAFIYNIFK